MRTGRHATLHHPFNEAEFQRTHLGDTVRRLKEINGSRNLHEKLEIFEAEMDGMGGSTQAEREAVAAVLLGNDIIEAIEADEEAKRRLDA